LGTALAAASGARRRPAVAVQPISAGEFRPPVQATAPGRRPPPRRA